MIGRGKKTRFPCSSDLRPHSTSNPELEKGKGTCFVRLDGLSTGHRWESLLQQSNPNAWMLLATAASTEVSGEPDVASIKCTQLLL